MGDLIINILEATMNLVWGILKNIFLIFFLVFKFIIKSLSSMFSSRDTSIATAQNKELEPSETQKIKHLATELLISSVGLLIIVGIFAIIYKFTI